MSGTDTLGNLQLVTELAFGAPSSGATGYMDFNDLSTQEPASPDPVSAASYTADAFGRVMLTITDTAGTDTYNLNLYLDGNGDALAISLDTTDTLGGSFGGQVTNTGTDANFNTTYAGTFFGFDAASGEFFSAVGPITATGTGDSLSGFTDFNLLGATTPDALLTGTYANYTNGNGILSPVGITGLDVDSSFANTDNFNMYEIDTGGDGVLIETDVNQLTLGVVQQ
jgi:hypothetical protein